MRKIIIGIIISAIFLLPSSWVAAQGLIPCGHGTSAADACTICHLIIGIKNLISFGQVILITVAAVGIFIGGFMYVISAGDQGAITSAKNFLAASLKGFAIFLLSWFIVNLVMWVLSFNPSLSIGQTNWYTFTCSTKSSATNPDGTSGNSGNIPPEVEDPGTPAKSADCKCSNGAGLVGPQVYTGAEMRCESTCEGRPEATMYSFRNGDWEYLDRPEPSTPDCKCYNETGQVGSPVYVGAEMTCISTCKARPGAIWYSFRDGGLENL